jgi:hypothetical protein
MAKFRGTVYGVGSINPPLGIITEDIKDENGQTIKKRYERYSLGTRVTFKVGEEYKEGVIDWIKSDFMTAKIDDKPNVPVDIETVKILPQPTGGKSRRKSRKNKSRRYRRV